jgi:SNF2 family DNA or RNA helicase
VQVCALLSVLAAAGSAGGGADGPFLVVAPASTLGNWQAELARWSPSLRCALFRTAGADRLTFHHELMHGIGKAGARKRRSTKSDSEADLSVDDTDADATAGVGSKRHRQPASQSGSSHGDSASEEEDEDGDDCARDSTSDASSGDAPRGARDSSASSGPRRRGISYAGRQDTPRSFDVLLTTYTLFDRSSESSRLDRAFLRRYRYSAIVLDEGHAVRKADSSRFKHLSSLQADFRLLLSGTPVQNSMSE